MSRLGREEKPWEKFCAKFTNRPIEPQQFQDFRFQVLKQRVGQLVTHDTLLKPFHSDWETMEIADEAQQQWDTAFPGDIGNRRLAHYLNAFAIDADDARKVRSFIRSFLAHVSCDNADTMGFDREERIGAFYDRPIDGRESALSKTMSMGDATLLRDLVELCRGVPLAKKDSDMLRRFVRVYRIDTSNSEEILAFFDTWKTYPPYSGHHQWDADSKDPITYVNCNLGAGVTPLQSALELAELDVVNCLVKLGARAGSVGSKSAGASE
jgi:hypothetical protein